MNTGAYILLLRMPQKACLIIGRLGEIEFPRGYYAYVGSAMNNLEKRIARHRLMDKPRHWHVDYLRPHAKWINAWRFESRDRIECRLNDMLIQNTDGRLVPKFGSSDCRCKSHLHHFTKNPSPLLDHLQVNGSVINIPAVFDRPVSLENLSGK